MGKGGGVIKRREKIKKKNNSSLCIRRIFMAVGLKVFATDRKQSSREEASRRWGGRKEVNDNGA